jgi:MarR family transcriptional regulator for hemolysin
MLTARARDYEQALHGGNEPHLLREVIRTYQVLMTGFSREIGIPASRLAVLRSLAITEGGAGVMDIARSLGINAAAVTRQIQDLERERLIQRRSDPKDGRRTHVSLSPKGRKLFEEIHERSHALERSLAAAISADEMATAATVLAKLRAFIEGLR